MTKCVKNSLYIQNRKVDFEYFIYDKLEAGIVLTGSEVRSIKTNTCDLSKSHILVDTIHFEMFILDLHIKTKVENHISNRKKKLLLKKREIEKFASQVKQNGFTIVPIALYVNKNGLIKIEIALARGKKLHDKRNTLRERDLILQNKRSDI